MNLQLIFKSVLNMSLTGSVVICFVLIVRMLLKKAPKMFSYALWAVVLFRLLCPVSFTSAFSLLGFTRATVSEPESVVTSVEYAPVQDIYQHKQENTEAEQVEPDHDYELPEVHPDQSIPENRTEVTQTPDAVSQQAPAEPVREPIYYAVMIWLVGMGVMLMYNVYSYSAENKEVNCEQLQSVNVGDLLQFAPEPENDYDPLAIRVVSQDGAHLGYIPRYYNKEILARLNKGMTYSCEVIEIDYDCSTSECIKVRVKMPCDE